MLFSQELWQSSERIYQAILDHPFNRELADGSLDIDKFRYYVQQDELYIRAYARALALLAAKAPTAEITGDLLGYAKDGILIEQQLHEHFFQKFKITPVVQQQPACFAYTHFLLALTALEPFPIGLAALLPCFWIYREVGHFIAKKSQADNPFQSWIDTYTDAAYDRVVDRMIEITDTIAAGAPDQTKIRMLEVFQDSARLEFAFWDAAYHLTAWPAFE